MIDFNNLSISRLIMHNIVAKTNVSDSATTVYEEELFSVNSLVLNTIKDRLIEAAGRNSKAFELELGFTGEGSFYSYCNNLSATSDLEFIQRSQEIAELLASTQLRSSIPGGYLIIIDALDSSLNAPVCIVIKAELHEALKYSQNEAGGSQIELLDQVFLSPSQKLFKIGILYQKDSTVGIAPNTQFGSFLFDDQFRDGSPAEYFYKDFLGFSISKNSKIQTKRFYDKTEVFIKELPVALELKQSMLSFLNTTFTVNSDPIITPYQFGNSIFTDVEVFDSYDSQVVSELPSSFLKDSILINTRLAKKKIDFPSNINIIGPDCNFDDRVTILTTYDDLLSVDVTDSNYTVVKILGKPFTNE